MCAHHASAILLTNLLQDLKKNQTKEIEAALKNFASKGQTITVEFKVLRPDLWCKATSQILVIRPTQTCSAALSLTLMTSLSISLCDQKSNNTPTSSANLSSSSTL